jgi:uncharacterized protein
MIIKLYDIQEGLSVRGALDASTFKRPEDSDISFVSPVDYELKIARAGDSIWMRGPVRGRLSLTCARCLEHFTLSVASRLDIELLPRNKAPRGSEVELKTEEMDIYYFEGDEIDIDPYIFEEIMLNIPVKALCAESCKGICPSCGKNLNIEDCRCERTGPTILTEKLIAFLKDR